MSSTLPPHLQLLNPAEPTYSTTDDSSVPTTTTNESSASLLASIADSEERRLTRADSMRQNLAYQIREMRRGREWTQAQFGKAIGKPQSVISRLENPDWDGKPSLQTLEEVADTFDVYLLVRFVRFSKFAEWATTGWPDEMNVPGYEKDMVETLGTPEPTVNSLSTEGVQASLFRGPDLDATIGDFERYRPTPLTDQTWRSDAIVGAAR
jgi:transcriptional regulator with XRE-family HTH domain